MAIYYDSVTSGFYNDDMRSDYESAGTWPANAIEISERWYQYLLNGQAKGQKIVINSHGQPVLADQSVPTKEELISVAENIKITLLRQAAEVIAPLHDAVDLSIATDKEDSLLHEWKTYRVQLSRIDTSKAPDIDWPAPPSNE